MYTRKQILENQSKFQKEISDSLKSEFKQAKRELSKIETKDKTIIAEKEKLSNRFNKVKVIKEIEKLFISEKNIYPNYYAWWDEANAQVIKLKYKQ